MIEIIPGIDIIEGDCVRLQQGDYEKKTLYDKDPLKVALNFEKFGIRRIHIVDLDGAKSKKVVNLDILHKICSGTNLCVDFGGGIKSDEDIESVFQSGADMVTIGSVAITDKPLFKKWIDKYGADKIILGADVKNKKIAINGWFQTTLIDVFEFLTDYSDLGIKNILCTDISRDGMLQGTATDLYKDLRNAFPDVYLIASGGISSVQEITKLDEIGIDGAIIGKAIYENHITLDDLQPFLNS